MLASMKSLLQEADAGGYAIGAFNVYNLEGIKAVIAAAQEDRSPVMLQLHPAALKHGGAPLVALCRMAAEAAAVPVGVHLDHSSDADAIKQAVATGVTSVMADGSHLDYEGNRAFTAEMAAFAHQHDITIEAELGRISGSEDGLTVEETEARYTDPAQAADFIQSTQIDALAVCIGNVHGKYSRPPRLDFERLAKIRDNVTVPLVLHGASGVPDDMVRQSIELGVRKFNVNTELRQAYIFSLRKGLMTDAIDLLTLLRGAEDAMQAVVTEKLRLFGSINTV